MEKYILLVKLLNREVPAQPVITLRLPDDWDKTTVDLLRLANRCISFVRIMAGVTFSNDDGEIETRTIPIQIESVKVWQYFEKYNGFMGITDTKNNPLPDDLKVLVYLKRIEGSEI